jgi:hypothetical protein
VKRRRGPAGRASGVSGRAAIRAWASHRLRFGPMRITRFATVVPMLLVLLLAAASAAGEEEPAAAPAQPGADLPTWYAQVLARGDVGLNVTHYWSKGSMLRAETVMSGHKIITIVSGQWYYAFDRLTGRGLAIRRDAGAVARDAPERRPFGNEYRMLLAQGAEKVGEEVLWGRSTEIFRVTDRQGRRELWVTSDALKLPLRVEIFDRNSGKKGYTEYVVWDDSLAIPDAFFEPDPDIAFERMEFEEYLRRSAESGSAGPVPVLYGGLLHSVESE